MTAHEALRTTFQALESAGVPHMLTGGFVTNLYAVPRFTKDADIVIQMEQESFARALPAEWRLDPQISFETITGSKRHILDVAGLDFRIALDWPDIESWCDRHGTRERLERIRASIPPLPPW